MVNSIFEIFNKIKDPFHPFLYLVICIILTFIVRLIHTFLKTISIGLTQIFRKEFWIEYIIYFKGVEPNKADDYWFGTLIGLAELYIFPFLIFGNELTVIGAWILIKTAGNWEQWSKRPQHFNRFLIANIINLVIAFFLAKCFLIPDC